MVYETDYIKPNCTLSVSFYAKLYIYIRELNLKTRMFYAFVNFRCLWAEHFDSIGVRTVFWSAVSETERLNILVSYCYKVMICLGMAHYVKVQYSITSDKVVFHISLTQLVNNNIILFMLMHIYVEAYF